MTALTQATYAARRRAYRDGGKGWSVAVLVPTKKLTRSVSEIFHRPPAGMAEIRHSAVVDYEGAILASEVVAFLLQPMQGDTDVVQFAEFIRNYFYGRRGGAPSRADVTTGDRIVAAVQDWRERLIAGVLPRRNSIAGPIIAAHERIRSLEFVGNPDTDWLAVRNALDASGCSRLTSVVDDLRNVRLLQRGTDLRLQLSQDWLENGAYSNALAVVRQAFVREHFAAHPKPERGVVIMNMHKAKGKQFDEVIIFEAWPRRIRGRTVANVDRIVRENGRQYVDDQCRQNMRVSVTRGKRRVTVLTPASDPCILLA